jgi:hypothetical protein
MHETSSKIVAQGKPTASRRKFLTGASAVTELRDRLSDRLNRLERNDKLVPLDRDPIPGRYTDLVRRYWKSLSEGR